jgi:hypothetical protein
MFWAHWPIIREYSCVKQTLGHVIIASPQNCTQYVYNILGIL